MLDCAAFPSPVIVGWSGILDKVYVKVVLNIVCMFRPDSPDALRKKVKYFNPLPRSFLSPS